MALGSTYQNNNGNNNNQTSMREPSYYSRLRIKNFVENLYIGFTFWKGTLRVSIGESGSAQEGRNNELAYIHLSPTKARMMADAVDRIIKNPESNDTFGVDTGSNETRGFIAIGRDKGNPFLVIAKVNDKGGYESSQRFNFNVDANYLLKVHDIANLKCQKEYMNNIELQQLRDVLADYARSASGALGASFHDIGRYEALKTTNLIKRIANKVGVPDSTNDGGGRSNNSFFNGANAEYEAPSSGRMQQQHRSRYQSIDDLESELG